MAFFSRSTQPAATVPPIETEGLAPNALVSLRNIEKSYAHGTSRSYVLRRINADIKKSERESMVCDILDKFAIVGKKDLYPNQLSGGQQQLVAVARAVISNPKVILADEPTGNLHSSQGKEIMELFKKLNEGGTTIIQVTHSETNASYGSRVVNLRDGWMVDE